MQSPSARSRSTARCPDNQRSDEGPNRLLGRCRAPRPHPRHLPAHAGGARAPAWTPRGRPATVRLGAERLTGDRRARRGGRDRGQDCERARARIPARAAGADRRFRRFRRPHRRRCPTSRRRRRPRPAAERQDRRPERGRRAGRRRDRRLQRCERLLGAGCPTRARRALLGGRRRLRLRPGALPRRRGRQRGGRLLALRDVGALARVRPGRRDRGQRRHLRGTPRPLRAARPLAQPRPQPPLRPRQARLPLSVRAGAPSPRRSSCRRSRASSTASGG